MVRAFEYKNDRTAVQIMRRMLDHGAEQLTTLKAKKQKEVKGQS
jgi:cell division protein YceG involved in septum cleavage